MATSDSPLFGDLLRRYRLAAGLSQEALAERAGVSARSVSDLERGIYRAPHRDTVTLLGEALELAAEDRARLESAVVRRRGPGAAAPPVHAASLRGLPLAPTPLLGRDQDIATLTVLLQRADVRLVTLTGPGGVGKTRLGAQVAMGLGAAFPDGVVFVPLASIDDAGLVAAAIAQALGVKETGDRPLPDLLMDYLTARQLLLVLDNFEQVLAAAPLVADLLAACPDLTVLVMSRTRLRVRGEHEVVVPPLALPAPRRSPELASLSDYAAVALFIARAQDVKAAFTVTEETAAAVTAICRRLDGLPLAIELAAAWIKLFPPQALLGRLERPLTLLSGGARDLPARQRTLRDTLAWSYDLLDPGEQELFRRLGVFADGCTLEAAEAVCTAAGGLVVDVLTGIASLVDKSLLRQEETSSSGSPLEEPRFAMLETIRAYAVEQLEASTEAPALRQRHAAYFLALAEQAEPQLTHARQGEWLARLEREHDNLRSALHWAQESGETELGLRLAAALWRFWLLHGHLSAGRTALERILALEARQDTAAARAAHARVLYGAGVFATEQGDFGPARAWCERSLVLYRDLDDKAGIASVLTPLGHLARHAGAYGQAAALYAEGLALAQETGNNRAIAIALNNLGMVAHQQSDHDRAAALFEESLALRRLWGDTHGIAVALNNLGDVARAQGHAGRAVTLYEESLALRQELGDTGGIANALFNLGDMARDRGDAERAAVLYARSLELYWHLGAKKDVAECLEGLAGSAVDLAQPERAARLCGAEAALRLAIGAPRLPAERRAYECTVAATRAALGEDAFAEAWAAGQASPLEEAIAEAVRQANGA